MGNSHPSVLPNGRTRLLGILGDPLDHSLSPALHSAVLARLDRNLIYVPVPVSARRLPSFLKVAYEAGFRGLNVTTPFKEVAFRSVTPLDRETERTRMVNTIVLQAGANAGCGTDGAGMLAWLERFDLAGARIATLGFGPTARSFVHRAWQEGAAVEVWTRRPEPARRELARWGAAAPARRWQDAPDGSEIAVVVSTLPPEVVLPDVFWKSLSRRAVVLDMNYGKGRTTMRGQALAAGLRAADGLGPLLEQASRSLSLWMGESIPTRLFERAGGFVRADVAPARRS